MKTPSEDFALRSQLDGSETLFTQSKTYEPPEQRFTVETLATYLAEQIGGNEPNQFDSGLTEVDGTVHLGGALQENTIIDTNGYLFRVIGSDSAAQIQLESGKTTVLLTDGEGMICQIKQDSPNQIKGIELREDFVLLSHPDKIRIQPLQSRNNPIGAVLQMMETDGQVLYTNYALPLEAPTESGEYRFVYDATTRQLTWRAIL